MDTSQCSLFRELSMNVEYHVIVAIKGVLCLAGAFRIMLQWKKYGVRYLVHNNTKVFFRFYNVLNILMASIFGFIYLCELIRLRFDCLLLDFRYILMTRCVGIATIVAAHQLIIIISFERLYSAIFPAHFERHSSKFLAVSLALIEIVITYVYSMMMMSDNFRLFKERKVALLNESLPENRVGFESLMTTMAIGNCLSLVMLSLDLYLNYLRKPKPSTNHSLSVSYQVSENRRIILILLPIELTQTLLGLFASTALVVHGKLVPTPTPIGQQLFLERVTFTTFFPLILTFFIRYSVEKKELEVEAIVIRMNASKCSIFAQLSQSFEYHILTVVKFLLCFSGGFRLSLQWKHYGVRFLVHENTKIFFRFYFALNIVYSAIFGCLHFFEMARLRFDCFLIDFRLILLTRCMGISTVYTAQHVMLILSFERLYSALYPAHFERNSSKLLSVSLAMTAIIGTYLFSMIEFSNHFLLFRGEKIEVALLNPNIDENQIGFKNVMSKMALTNCISLLTLCIDFYINFIRKAKGKSTSLSVSYQRAENRRIVLALLPIEFIQTVMGLFTPISIILYGKFVSSPNPIGHQIFFESVTLIVGFPLILTFFIKYSVEKSANRTAPIDPEIDHFEELRKSWN